jgi:hypothetical protein
MDSLEKIIEKEDTDKNDKKLARFKKLFGILQNFFKTRKIILYGGLAMNYHLPKNKRFYKDDEFPDFDCFSLNPKKDAIDLSNIFKKLGYKYIEIKYAMHEGTYKLFVDFEAICDLTKISKVNHKIIFDQAEEIEGYLVAPVKQLKSFAYLELGIPKSSLFRWQKVISRIKLLEENFLNNKSSFSKKQIQYISFNDKIVNVVNDLRKNAITNDLVLCGNDAIDFQLHGSKGNNLEQGYFMLTNSSGLFQCMSSDMNSTVDKLKKILQKHKLTNIETKIEKDDFMTPYTKIFITYYDDQYTYENLKLNICTVFSADEHCYSYVKHKNIKYCSIFFILHVLYKILYKDYKNENIDKVNIKNIINVLINKIDMNSFKTECYGSELTMSVIRKQRWDEKKPVVLLRIN